MDRFEKGDSKMTHKKRLFSALAVVAAGSLLLTFAGPYKSGAKDPIGASAAWDAYSDDNEYSSVGTFHYDAPGDNEDVTLAASDITKLKDQIGKLALTAQAADTGLDSSMAGAVNDASTANAGALASLKASVDTLNATLANKEFGRDTTVMVYRTSVGNVDLAQATVYEAMTMSASGLPTFSNPASSLYAVYALGDNPAVDLTTATPLGLYSSCSGGYNSAFNLSYFPRGAYDKDTAVTLTLPANGSSANAYNVGEPYFFALARIAAEDRETKFGLVQVAKAQKCNMADLPAKCGSAESIDDAKYVFWFGDDVSGEPDGIWKGAVATSETMPTSSISQQETKTATSYYVANTLQIAVATSTETVTGYSGTYSSAVPQRAETITETAKKWANYRKTDIVYYSNDQGSTIKKYTFTYTGTGDLVYSQNINIRPLEATATLSGFDYVYWTDKTTGSEAKKTKGSASVTCTYTKNYCTASGDVSSYRAVSGGVSLTGSRVGNTYKPAIGSTTTLADQSDLTTSFTVSKDETSTVMFAPIVK